MLISDEYRELNRIEHLDPNYGIAAASQGPLVQKIIRRARAKTLLDYGCGKQSLRKVIRGVQYRAYDPAIPGLDEMPEPADVVYCGDVMEHVEPEYTDAVIEHVVGLAHKAAIFVICCEHGRRILGDGKPAHRNVHPPEYWRKKLLKYGRLDEYPGTSKKREIRLVVWRH